MSNWKTLYFLSTAALLALMSLVAVGLRLGILPAPASVHVQYVGHISARALFAVTFMPVWLVIAWVIAQVQKRRIKMRPSDEHRRVANRGLIAVTAFSALPHLWICISVVTGSAPARELMVRACIVFVGLMFAIQGNFLAKTAPPTGEGAPSAAAWTRHMLRVGWSMVLLGVIMTVCGFVLPFGIVAWTGFFTIPMMVISLQASRRRMRAS